MWNKKLGMKIKRYLLVVSALFFACFMHAQIQLSETIQSSKISNPDNKSLFFVDFWATWCGPCVFANEYLEVLQKQYSDKFYVVSITEENPEKVKRYVENRPTDLAVVIDYEGMTFDKNKVKVLPYGILLNAKGIILWKGSPTDFKASHLEKFLKQNSNVASFEDVFKIESIDNNKIVIDYIPEKNFEIKELTNVVLETLKVSSKNGFKQYNGSLSSILANSIQVIENQIIIPDNLNKHYQIFIKENEELLPYLISSLDIELSGSVMEGEVLVVDNSNERFWDTNQIDWGNDTARYLIDDTQIQADNVNFKDVLYQLSTILELPIVTTTSIDDSSKHDWMIHHKFFSLMQSDVLDNYGLQVEKKHASYKTYIITKKTP